VLFFPEVDESPQEPQHLCDGSRLVGLSKAATEPVHVQRDEFLGYLVREKRRDVFLVIGSIGGVGSTGVALLDVLTPESIKRPTVRRGLCLEAFCLPLLLVRRFALDSLPADRRRSRSRHIVLGLSSGLLLDEFSCAVAVLNIVDPLRLSSGQRSSNDVVDAWVLRLMALLLWHTSPPWQE